MATNTGREDMEAAGIVRNGESQDDASDILADQDATEKLNVLADDENLGAHSKALDSLEEEPASFMEGRVDVKTQMDRAKRNIEEHGTDLSSKGELAATFKNTPGGLEEVAKATDEELARRHRLH